MVVAFQAWPGEPMGSGLRYVCSVSPLKYIADGEPGDVVYIHVLGKSIIILNSSQAVSDLLNARSHIYSDRPHFTIVGEVTGAANVSLVVTVKCTAV
jgi:hypothetical protein